MSKNRNIADLGSNDVLETTSTGVEVTGTVTADGLVSTVSSTQDVLSTARDGTSAFLTVDHGTLWTNFDSGERITFNINGTRQMLIGLGGDISFYDSAGVNQKFFWDASTESLGIGTTSTGTSSSIVLDSSLQNNIRFNNGGTFKGYIGVAGAANNLFVGSVADELALRSSSAIAFAAGNARSMTIDSSGNVGIGTSSPSSHLQVYADGPTMRLTTSGTTNASSLQFGDDQDLDVGYVRYEHNGDYMRFGVNTAERMRIDSSGNVGIGTDSPSNNLHVVSTDSSQASFIRNATGTSAGGVTIGNNTTTHTLGSSSGGFTVYEGSTERMRIDSAGRVTMPYQPAFNVQNTSSYTVETGSQLITFNSINTNVGNHWNSSTNRFTAPVAGVYHFSATIDYNNLGNNAEIQIWKNGFCIAGQYETDTGTTGSSISVTIYCNANDYIDVHSYSGVSREVTGRGDNFTFFSGHLVG